MNISPVGFSSTPPSFGDSNPKKPATSTPVFSLPPKLDPELDSPSPMGHALAAHILGGAHVSGIHVDGQKIEGFSGAALLRYFSGKMRKMAQDSGIDTQPKIQNWLKELEGAEEIDYLSSEIQRQLSKEPWEERSKRFAQELIKRLTSLGEGESLLLRGGWRNLQEGGGHAILYRVTKEKGGKYAFTLYNSGSGLQFHSVRQEAGQPLFVQQLTHQVTEEQILNPIFWSGCYELSYGPQDGAMDSQADHFYRWLDSLDESFLEKARAETSGSGLEMRRAQRSGNCAFESLLAYSKIQLKGEARPFYHQLKVELQLATLQEYWSFLEKDLSRDPKDLIDPKASQKTLQLLDLVAKEIHTVESTLLKQLKKRATKKTEIDAIQAKKKMLQTKKKELDRIRKTYLNYLQSMSISPFSAGLHPIMVETPAPKPIKDLAIQEVDLSDSISSPVEDWKAELIGNMEDESFCHRDIRLSPTALPDLEDQFWVEHAPKLFVPFVKKVTLKISPNRNDIIYIIRLLAICVKLAKHAKEPVLSTRLIDRRFISELLTTVNSQLLVALDKKTAESFKKCVQFLHENSKQNGVFREFFSPEKEVDFNEEGRSPDSVKDLVLQYLGLADLRSKKKLTRALGDNPTDAQKAGYWLWNQPAPAYKAMGQLLFQLRRQVFYSSKDSSASPVWLRGEHDLHNKPVRFMLDFYPSAKPAVLFSSFDIPKDKQKQFIDWLQPVSEELLREKASSKKGMPWLDFQLRMIRSEDDPSLRISRAIEFFTLHGQFLERPECQKFLFVTFFQVSLQDGSSAWHEYLKSNPPKSRDVAMQFIQQGLEKFADKPGVFCFFLEMGLHIYHLFSEEEQQKITLFPQSALLSMNRLLTETKGQDKSIYMRLMESARHIFYPRLSISILSDAPKEGCWPFLLSQDLLEFSALNMDKMGEKEKQQFLSGYVFGKDFGEKWHCEYPKAVCGDYTVDMRCGKIWYRGYIMCKSITDKNNKEFVPAACWKSHFPSSHICVVGNYEAWEGQPYGEKAWVLQFSILRDLDTGQEYLLQVEGAKKKFYQKMGKEWVPLIALGELEHKEIFSRLGISAANGWKAICNPHSVSCPRAR